METFTLDSPVKVETVDGAPHWIVGPVTIVGWAGPGTDHHIADSVIGWVRLPIEVTLVTV